MTVFNPETNIRHFTCISYDVNEWPIAVTMFNTLLGYEFNYLQTIFIFIFFSVIITVYAVYLFSLST